MVSWSGRSELTYSNTIAPGVIDTPVCDLFCHLTDIQMTQNQNLNDSVSNLPPIPAKRMGLPQEIAEVAVFLSSESASYVNGAVWPVDGGYTVD
jgi:NAD(P)-dependent dehydrogenase (short-subunit alcohol dehydrogenase family)